MDFKTNLESQKPKSSNIQRCHGCHGCYGQAPSLDISSKSSGFVWIRGKYLHKL